MFFKILLTSKSHYIQHMFHFSELQASLPCNLITYSAQTSFYCPKINICSHCTASCRNKQLTSHTILHKIIITHTRSDNRSRPRWHKRSQQHLPQHYLQGGQGLRQDPRALRGDQKADAHRHPRMGNSSFGTARRRPDRT